MWTVVADGTYVADSVVGYRCVAGLDTVVAGIALASDVVLTTFLAVVAGVTRYAVSKRLLAWKQQCTWYAIS